MAALRENSLWQRGLRRGSRGVGVKQLQERLAFFGYDVGENDGYFGYLTEDALVQFQREHRLRADGVAGPEVWEVLNKPRSIDRTVHIVQPGERLIDLAAMYRVSERWIRRTNRKKRGQPLYPGERIILRSSCILIGLGQSIGSFEERTLMTRRRLFSGVVDPACTYSPDGAVEGVPDEDRITMIRKAGVPLVIGVRPVGVTSGRHAFRRGKHIVRFVNEIAERMNAYDAAGLFWDVGHVRAGYGKKLMKAVLLLKKAMPEKFLAVSMAPARRGIGLFLSDVDYKVLARHVDRVVVATHRWNQLIGNDYDAFSYNGLGSDLSATVRIIPPWKLLLGIPLGAAMWESGGPSRALSYQSALTHGYAVRKRPILGEDGFMRITIPVTTDDSSGQRQYMLQSARSLEKLLKIAYQYRLGGVMLDPMGYEERRQWDILVESILPGPLM